MIKLPQNYIFTFEEKTVHHLMLQANSIKKNGLLYGKIGVAIAFFEYGRCRNNLVYIDYAKELKDSLPKKIHEKMPLDFATGLCGFGWGIEYMTQQMFVSSDTNDICAYVDQKVMAMDMLRISDLTLEAGLEGFLHYILIRLKNYTTAPSLLHARPFDDAYLKDVYNKLQSVLEGTISTGLKLAFVSYMDTGILSYKPDIRLFASNLELKNEEDILSAKLGLSDGLAGKLTRISQLFLNPLKSTPS